MHCGCAGCGSLSGGGLQTGARPIDRRTLLNWLKRGERERAGMYRELYLAVERAEAKAEVFHLKNIETASAKSWFASAWFLERKHPERWGKREPSPHFVPPNDVAPN